MSDLGDAAIRVSEGDASAFTVIVDATHHKLVRLAARMLGNLADAQDVVQDAYVRAYRSLTAGQFDQRSKVETWLYRIVVNATIDARRKRKRTRTDELVEAGWDGTATADAIVALRELSAWIAELPDEQQAALVLKSVEGLSSAEVAAILECSEGAVEQRLVRARAALRAHGGRDD